MGRRNGRDGGELGATAAARPRERTMELDWPILAAPIFLLLLLLVSLAGKLSGGRFRPPGYFGYFQAYLLASAMADFISFTPAVWLMAVISFRALREYFSLVDLRIEDRWGMLGAYLSIPFMFYLVQIDWYGFFIVSIPVYAFIVVPFLVALGGGDGRGSLWSVGALDFGLFFFVYCVGHLAYLAFYSTWLVVLLLLILALCERIRALTARWPRPAAYLPACALGVAVSWALRPWTHIPAGAALFAGALIPTLAWMGGYTVGVLERDMGIGPADLEPGRGRVVDSLGPVLFAAPIVFHVLRWTMKFGELVVGHGR
jgi:phosphatidate cytidylyltransferase